MRPRSYTSLQLIFQDAAAWWELLENVRKDAWKRHGRERHSLYRFTRPAL